MSYYIRCYEGQDEWGAKKWLAHMNLGNDIYMSFFGHTKKEAEDKGHAWYAKESARFKHMDSSQMDSKPKAAPVVVMNNNDGWGSEGWGGTAQVVAEHNGWPNEQTATGRGHHFAGKVWMVNKTTGDKKRIDPSEQSTYEANGYVRGGPRS